MKKHNIYTPLLATALFVSACGSEAVLTDPSEDYEVLDSNSHTQFIYEGDSVVLRPETGKEAAENLRNYISETHFSPGFQEPGIRDISPRAQRFVVKVMLDGESAKLRNDMACELVSIEKTKWKGTPYIAALAVGKNSDQSATVAWPEGSDKIQFCVEKGDHPSSGIIVAAPEVAR